MIIPVIQLVFCKGPVRRRKRKYDDLMLKNLKELEKKSARMEDEEVFGKQIAATLRRLTYHQKAQAKMRIHSVLFNVEFPEEGITQQQC